MVVVNANACPCEIPSFEKTYDSACPKVVDALPKPNPAYSEPDGSFSNLCDCVQTDWATCNELIFGCMDNAALNYCEDCNVHNNIE